MNENMKEEKTSTKRIKRIINIFAAIWSIVLVAAVIYIRIKSNIPAVLLYMCMGVVYVGGLLVFQKVLEHSRMKKELEEANRECEEEEEGKSAVDEKPDHLALTIVALIGFFMAISGCVDTVSSIITAPANGLTLQGYMPQCVEILTLLICCTFIAIILYNVSKRRVFDNRNSFCIYGVGATIMISTLLQNECWETTTMLPNGNVTFYYMLFGTFIIFFGRLFDIAIKLKKEQDLTI